MPAPPGKVPANLVKKMHGPAIEQDALQKAVQEGVQALMAEKQLRPAIQPAVELGDGYEPGKDAEVTVTLEVLPDVPAPAIDGLTLERLTVEPGEDAIDEAVNRIATQQKSWDDAARGTPGDRGRYWSSWISRVQGGRRSVRRRHRRGHVDRAWLGPPDPRLRGRSWKA